MGTYYIKENAMELLQNELSENAFKYKCKEPYVDLFFKDMGLEDQWSFRHSEYPKFKLDMKVSEHSYDDIENAIYIYSQLKFLTPSDANDKRLWVFLTHAQGWEYMVTRWPIQRVIKKADKDYLKKERNETQEEFILGKVKRFLNERYFFDGKFLYRHGLARLWWAAHLTYDQEREDPYELLRVLFHNQDVATQILERSFSHNKKVLHTYLQYLLDEHIEKEKSINRKLLREQTKNIMFVSNVSMLDTMDEESLRKTFSQC